MEGNPLLWDIRELALHLRRERLFVQSEQVFLQELNEKVVSASSKLAQVAWVTSQQRLNLNRLVISCPDATPAACCRRAKFLEATQFVDAQKVLGFQTCISYGELLCTLRESPDIISRCLVAGDRLLLDEMDGVVQSVLAGLYASCVLPQDKLIVLRVLNNLISLQLMTSESPRRLLKQGSCAFARLYSSFHESLFSAKLFLTAALHSPIMQLLMTEEQHLDIDPDKAVQRLSREEKVKRFGVEGSAEYKAEIEKHRAWTVKNLVLITQSFINSLHENLHCFPSSVCWLVSQIYNQLAKGSSLPEKEVFAMCTDMVFTLFVCPAIVTPEPYGITDVPISSVNRFNLIQVAQILQMLAMRKYQQIDPKVEDLYSQFNKECVSSIIDSMIEGGTGVTDPILDDNMKLEGMSRSAALFTENELYSFVTFLRTVMNEANCEDIELQKTLSNLLSQIPVQAANGHSKSANPSPEHSLKKPPVPNKGGRGKVTNGGLTSTSENGSPTDNELTNSRVLVIPFNVDSESRLGLDSEQKVLALDKEVQREADRSIPMETERNERNEGQEKRTRFSLSHDDGSIGNTSDNLEVVSEAPSNHSVASSLELETEDQNDNLSDMVSANVSGRGSPNISGRDTPSSQITEGDDGGQVGSASRQPLDFNNPPQPPKHCPARFDIDDKFGKFEIKTLIEGTPCFGADETVSLVSDTWSTDVLASDSETVEQSSVQLPPPILPEPSPALVLADTLDTASEAWSTDVMASDSERMTEVDTDDTASVARSDDTGRSEIESRGEPEPVDDPQPSLPQPLSTSGSGSAFRIVREEIPLRIEEVNISGGMSPPMKVSDRVDYRRRTMEYVDSNRNIYTKQNAAAAAAAAAAGSVTLDEMSRLSYGSGTEKPPDLKPALVSTTQGIVSSMSVPVSGGSPTHGPSGVSFLSSTSSTEQGGLTSPLPPPHHPSPLHSSSLLPPSGSGHRLHFRSSSQHTSSQEISIEDDRMDREISSSGCYSTASLASTSSSGSSIEVRNACTDIGLSSTPLVMQNGSVVLDSGTQIIKPTPTGAIPKSISFDKTAERGDKEALDEDGKHKKSFFRNFKLPFKNKRVKSFRAPDCYESSLTGSETESIHVRVRRGMSEEGRTNRFDTSDDILAKYRRKPVLSEAENETKGKIGVASGAQGESGLPCAPDQPVTSSYQIEDAKKKLRLVLSTSEIQGSIETLPTMRQAWLRKENDLVAFLQLQLAEAINLQNRVLIPHLHETLRCVKMMSPRECRELLDSLKEDYKSREPYITYLVKCRQALLSTLAHLERLLERVKSDSRVVLQFLSSVCVRLFLEKREALLETFIGEFQELTLADEKSYLLDSFFQSLSSEMERDPVWQNASESQIMEARTAVERSIFSRVYLQAMYPNGDGDVSRDEVLHKHMEKLSLVITPNHKDLQIPKMFHYECPWLSAQNEISQMAAYRSPSDKLKCVLRCITTIMNLLSISCVPAADDLMPVLVFVLIKANPPSLLSTVEYVTSFYGNRLEGEDQYYWIQFCSAIEFIKTMDYITGSN